MERRRLLLLLATAGALVLAALLWLTVEVQRLEDRDLASQRLAQHQELLRIALWRMDSHMAARLAREAARPAFEWSSFYAPGLAYNRLLQQVPMGDVLSPSPLLVSRGGLFPLYFQIDSNGAITSPQLPTGNLLDLAESTVLPDGVDAQTVGLMATLAPRITAAGMLGALTLAEAQSDLDSCAVTPHSATDSAARLERQSGQVAAPSLSNDYQVRSKASSAAQQSAQSAQQLEWNSMSAKAAEASNEKFQSAESAVALATTVGAMSPIWLPLGERTLAVARRVETPAGPIVQGIVLDWNLLSAELLGSIEDLLPLAELEPLDPSSEVSNRLASVPIGVLTGPMPDGPMDQAWAPTTAVLVATWVAAAAALSAASMAALAGVRYGERQRRFTSSVTHELRTPLTTFQLYSDLLAEGMIPEESRRDYLSTLRSEARRLSHIVENVLAYARLERGAKRPKVQTANCQALADRLEQCVRRRCADAGAELRVTHAISPGECLLDAAAAEQVVLNLADNACKYGNGQLGLRLELEVSCTPQGLDLKLRDYGPGIPAALRRRIFAPYERLPDAVEQGASGAGLGLAISRALAEAMGGTVSCAAPDEGPGVRFTFWAPSRRASA